MTDYPALLGECEARLREMKERADAAPRAPWHTTDKGPAYDRGAVCAPCPFPDHEHEGSAVVLVSNGNMAASLRQSTATFAAHARTDLPALVGWALEMIEAHKRVPLGTFGARESWPTLESLARALGIMPKAGG